MMYLSIESIPAGAANRRRSRHRSCTRKMVLVLAVSPACKSVGSSKGMTLAHPSIRFPRSSSSSPSQTGRSMFWRFLHPYQAIHINGLLGHACDKGSGTL